MRQYMKHGIVANVSVMIVLALLAYGCDEDHSGHDHMEEGGPTEEMQGQERHDMDADNHSDAEVSGKIVDEAREVDMKARQYEFDPATVVVKSGEKVRLMVTSEDVEHGIAIKDYDIDRTLEPQETETIEFTAGDPGTHHFHCSVYCGQGHDQMHGELIVIEGEEESE